MSGALSRIARTALLTLDPETAHHAALTALKTGLAPRQEGDSPLLKVTLFGLDFPNPFGMAAGFDKNAEVADEILSAGFGFHEVGGITPRPQPGESRPRVFRLIQDRALINRLGFNNDGLRVVARRLRMRRRGGIVGANLGANKDSEDKAADYVILIKELADCVDYFTINVSSPNTPGLRDLQRRGALDDLLARALEAREAAQARRPILVKIAPDLNEQEFEDVLTIIQKRRIDGLILSNTTLSRAGLRDAARGQERGGLSGAPLFRRSTILLAKARMALGPDFPLIGVGGVSSVETAWAKISAGASLVQLYTGLVYEGFDLLGEMKRGVARMLRRGGFASIPEAAGRDAARWAAEKL